MTKEHVDQIQDQFEMACRKCGSKEVHIYSSGCDGEISIKCKNCENEIEIYG